MLIYVQTQQTMMKRYYPSAILPFVAAFIFGSATLADPDELSETETRAALVHGSLNNCLTKESYQLANQLGVMQFLKRLQLLSEHDKHKHGNPLSPECTTLRIEVDQVIITTALQCQEVIAEIEREVSDGVEVKSALESKRDSAIKTNSIANVIGNGLIQTVGELEQIPFETVVDSRYELPGESVEGAGNIMGGGFGALALHQNSGVKLSATIKPNMLAKVFKRPNDSDTEYPDVIWNYLNTPPPGSKEGTTRREALIRRWEDLGRIPAQTTPKGRLYMRTLAGTVAQNKTVTISMLDDRTAMLLDLRAEVNQIYKELLNMMLVVRAL